MVGRISQQHACVPAHERQFENRKGSGVLLVRASTITTLDGTSAELERAVQHSEDIVSRRTSWMSTAVAFGLASSIVACGDKTFATNVVVPLNGFVQTNLVANAAGTGAVTVDASLVNPWGIAFGSNGFLWVANNGSGVATVYDGSGTKQPLTVTIPGAGGAQGVPTGTLFNSTTDFVIPGSTAASFIFAGEDGTISAWNTSEGTLAHMVFDGSASGAVFKGIAMASSGGANRLYLTDFHNGHVDMFDASFHFMSSFGDAGIPAGFAPFGIANIGGQLYVTYAKQHPPEDHDDEAGVGNGFVDVFNPDGTLARRFASNGTLNSPWAVVSAPSGFGIFAGDILVGNFGDGRIGAYNPTTGAFIDVLKDGAGNAIVIPGLWGLAFGPATGSTTLYFASGPNNEMAGLVGTLTPR
jgi:uncharacterized protein (TIGR03118 family)